MTFNYREIGKILAEAFLEAWKWKIGAWLITAGIGLVSGIIIPIGKDLLEWDTTTALVATGSIVIVMYLIRFMLILVKLGFKYLHEVYKNSIYGDAIIKLKDCFAEAHYYRKVPGFNNEEFMSSMISQGHLR